MKIKEFHKQLKNLGFEVHRESGKHRIYVHSKTGKKLSTSKTPSDRNAWKQAIRDIERYKLAG